MNCPPGYIATVNGAKTETEGCQIVGAGLWSPGLDTCTPYAINCPAGHYAAKVVGATSAQDGCVECGIGYYS